MSPASQPPPPKNIENSDSLADRLVMALSQNEQDFNPALNSIFEERDLVERLGILPIWLASLGLHLLLLIFLGTIYLGERDRLPLSLIAQPGEAVGLDLADLAAEELDIADFSVEPLDYAPQEVEQPMPMETLETPPALEAFVLADSEAVSERIEPIRSIAGGAFAGRLQNKGLLLRTGGGSEESEKAVQLALAWIVRHQLPNGSWSFDLSKSPNCKGGCANSGTINAPNAATAMALLPLLGAGQTPTKGEYRRNVARGIDFLLQNGQRTQDGYDMHDSGGTMYAHGLATIVLCETVAMSDSTDKSRYRVLQQAAQEAIRFIEYAQDPNAGGWRYQPRAPGDTSVVGWQLMALKSADYGGLSVQSIVPRKSLNFLVNQVGSAPYGPYGDGFTQYGYSDRGRGTPSTTAIGLLCRLFLDWSPNHPALLAGIDRLLAQGPDFASPYFIYYATQLIHHVGGGRWTTWNDSVRDPLIAMQVQEGEMAGSWFPANADSHAQRAGRLYATSLFCMTLEVYYRHLPLYQLNQKGGPLEFPLD